MANIHISKRIRFRLLTAFSLVVLIALAAVITAGFSITRTQERLNAVMTETLPLEKHSKRLDKEAALFAAAFNELPTITTDQQRVKLVKRLHKHLTEIKTQLDTLHQFDFERHTIQILKSRIDQLEKSMLAQDRLTQDYIGIKIQLALTVSQLKEKHEEFIKTTSPRISEGYKAFLKKGEDISTELREVVILLSKRNELKDIEEIDNTLRIGIETLISSAAGEMRSNLEIVALTNLAAGILNEAATAYTIEQVKQLQQSFEKMLPKVRRINLILAHSTPENNQVLITSLPIFRFGGKENSIFKLRIKELTIREITAASAQNTFSLSEEVATEINNLTITSQNIASEAANRLRSTLGWAAIIQIIAGVAAITFSIMIGWFYVQKQVIERLLILQKSMEQHVLGENVDIPLSGNDEISRMAHALQSFVEQRSNVENKLRKTLDEFSAVMDSINYGIVFMDADLKASIVNNAFKKMWEIKDEDIADQPTLRELISINRNKNVYNVEEDEFENYLDEQVTAVRHGYIAPQELETKDGKTFQHQCVELPDGGRMLTYFEITELKTAEKKLIQSQKMEAIGLMAGGVAHDLNNILSGIVAYPDILLLKLPAESDLHKPIKAIKESGQRAAEVVADLLTVARGVAATREVTDLNILIYEYLNSPECKSLNPRFPNITIATDLDDDLFNVSCSPIHIKKCLMNLVMNAAEAIEGNGEINISAQNQYLELSALPSELINEGEYIVVSIEDNGPGVSTEDLNHIFEPFYTKKTMGRSGTGLGLTIVWNTVQEHGGAVTVTSNQSGTTFKLFFPATREIVAELQKSMTIKDIQGSSESILIVDDEPLQRNIASQILASLNYQVTAVGSGEEAIMLIEKEPFDLVILDMIMSPGINGRMTYEQIVKNNPGQKAILASGFTDDEEVKKAQSLGAGNYLKKPYTLKEIGFAVKKEIGRHGNRL